MMNTTLEILPFPEEIPHNLIESQTNRITLLRRRFSRCQLEVSIEKNGHLRGWITVSETKEIKLKGLPAYLNLKKATQFLNQSYLKLQKEAITVLPKGLGGGMEYSRPSFALRSNKAEACEKEALQLVEAISNDEKRKVIRQVVEGLLKNDPEEKTLHFYDHKIGETGIQALGIALQVNHTLQSLKFRNNQIEAAGAQALGTALQVNQSLQSLDLSRNQIGNTGARALGAALKINQSLQSLELLRNSIGAIGAQALRAALEVNHTLQSLNLEDNRLGNGGAQVLGAALKVNQSLQSLNLRHNNIGTVGIQALGTALQVNQSLQSLNLGWNHIDVSGAQALGTALQVNQSLQSLNLENNKIGEAGAQALASPLEINQSLQSLNLNDNHIGDTGAQALGAALAVNQSLQSLSLWYDNIGDAGAQALGAALQVNQSLQSLNLNDNRIGDTGAQALGTALQTNQSLQSLSFWHNHIGDAGAEALGVALQVNHTFQSLDLWHNQIGDEGARALGAALQVNVSLQSLCLISNQIGNDGAQALEDALQINDTLHALDFSDIQIVTEETITMRRIKTLLQTNKQIATLFQQQITQVQNFLQSHENNEDMVLQDLPQLKELLSKWYTDSKDIIPSLQAILIQSGKTNLNDRYREKLEGIITNLINRLHDLWLKSFDKKVIALYNEYVKGKESSKERNVDLGYALYETWLTFVGSDCPNWLENHHQSLIPFGVLLDIAESENKQDVSELIDPHLLFERVFLFRNKKYETKKEREEKI